MADQLETPMLLPPEANIQPHGRVACLGLTFENDETRRSYFLGKLREKLKDPAFHQIEGFPIGSDEDILALSDPPYYTACPNPFIEDFIRCYGKPYEQDTDTYACQPLTADVQQTRDTLIYSAHAYHTKVPPQAIVRYISHFTRPGDIVLDAFAGSGMTGVACRLLKDHEKRHVILCDLAPAATFIAATYLDPPPTAVFDVASRELLSRCWDEVGKFWLTQVDGVEANVEFQVWSESFVCPHCQDSIETVDVVSATESIGAAKEFPCPHCKALVSKAPTKTSGATRLERSLKARFDNVLKTVVKYVPRAPLHTQITDKQLGRRKIDTPIEMRRLLETLDYDSEFWYPTDPLIEGERFSWKDCLPSYGITHIHHFYLPRQLKTFSCIWNLALRSQDYRLRRSLQFFLTSNALGYTVLNRYGPTHYSQVNKYFSGTLYIPSTIAEASPIYVYSNKRKRLIQAFKDLNSQRGEQFLITTQSSTALTTIPNNSVDYIFIDPPFGRNLQYSELNQIWEAWLRVKTNRIPEAVVDSSRKRDVLEYAHIMRAVFRELYRVLKPGRWMSIAFHNSSNAIWMAIQETLLSTGFVVADVRTLDKERQSYKQIRQGTVKQDLVISTYKPNNGLEERFKLEAGTEEGVWNFVRTHLKQLPVFVAKDDQAEVIAERQHYLLFDRMVAFHVQHGVTVPLSAAEFYEGLAQRFSERESMYFLPEQVAEYDKKRMTVKELLQLSIFVIDESSAIQWLKQQLIKKPQTFQELYPQFRKKSIGWQKHEKPLELSELLEENFLRYDGRGEVPSQIHSYRSTNFKELRNLSKDAPILRAKARDRWYVPDPNKTSDLEKLRERTLLREFEEYRDSKQKRMKVLRLEAVRAGFKKAWGERDYSTIIDVANKIPESVLQEDSKLLMWYDQAVTRTAPHE
jgi:16S rRNA G966 N2-methylase RsmD